MPYYVTTIQDCQCGAVTVQYENGAYNSMRKSTFNRLKKEGVLVVNKDVVKLPTSYVCNHCSLNHCGIDLCECGSGKRVGKCNCGSNKPFETVGEQVDWFGGIVKRFAMYH